MSDNRSTIAVPAVTAADRSRWVLADNFVPRTVKKLERHVRPVNSGP